jgi:hypothetical protein
MRCYFFTCFTLSYKKLIQFTGFSPLVKFSFHNMRSYFVYLFHDLFSSNIVIGCTSFLLLLICHIFALCRIMLKQLELQQSTRK